MASTFTPNIQLEEPARGDDVGTWDTPVNSNMTLVDKVVGGFSVISLNNSNVVLSAAQFQSRSITFNSTLTGNVAITFPTSFTKDYVIFNTCTGSSVFTVTLQTTGAGFSVIGCPPGEAVNVYNFGASGGLFFLNLGRIASLMEWGGSSVPAWISVCTTPPYLNCDGTTFSSATYPALAVLLGGTTLPDIRGTTRYTLNQGTGRLTSSLGGLDGNTNLSVKTTQTNTIVTSMLPPYTPSGTLNLSAHLTNMGPTGFNVAGGGTNLYNPVGGNISNITFDTATFTGVAQGGVSQPIGVIGTGTVAGITMIRSA